MANPVFIKSAFKETVNTCYYGFTFVLGQMEIQVWQVNSVWNSWHETITTLN